VFDGTWSGNGAIPGELSDYLLMRHMEWSWDELQSTPAYVRWYCGLFGAMEREAQARRG
jgi:hypothetical protein